MKLLPRCLLRLTESCIIHIENLSRISLSLMIPGNCFLPGFRFQQLPVLQ
jgi:hypothetical protein